MIRIEVWSDIVCPFCYIGKRNLEAALRSFGHRDQVQVVWRSFELDPQARGDTGLSLDELLARKYGRSVEWAAHMHEEMTERAKAAGLEYRFDRVIPANSFDAHRLTHLADIHGKREQAAERLFRGYYTLGENIGDRGTLVRIATEIGLDADEARATLSGERFAAEVRRDEAEAGELGVNAVPFFHFNRMYAISGAQPVEVFQRALQAAWNDRDSWFSADPADGACSIDDQD